MWHYRLHYAVDRIDHLVPRPIKRALKRVAPSLVDRFYRDLTRITPKNLVEVTIQSGLLEGRRFVCSLKDGRQYFLGNYEPDVIRVLAERVRPGATVLDVGAHFGYVGLCLATLVGNRGRVVLYEPNASNRRILEQNLALNPDLHARVEVRDAAVTASDGYVRFEEDSSWTGRVGEAGVAPGSEGCVAAVRLDTECASRGLAPEVIVMDIEGVEAQVLPQMTAVLARWAPLLVVEVHSADACVAFCDLISVANYEAAVISPVLHWGETISWTERAQYVAHLRPTASDSGRR